jgi:hypothetical protein
MSDAITQRLAEIGDELLEIHDQELALLDRRVVLGAEQYKLLAAQQGGTPPPVAASVPVPGDMRQAILAVTGSFAVNDLLGRQEFKRWQSGSVRACASALYKAKRLRLIDRSCRGNVYEVVRGSQ